MRHTACCLPNVSYPNRDGIHAVRNPHDVRVFRKKQPTYERKGFASYIRASRVKFQG